MLQVGDRVKYSEWACRSLRDTWNMAGSYEKKSQAARWLKEKQAERGTVIKSGENGIGCKQLDIQWDRGALSFTDPGMVVKVEEEPAPAPEDKPKRKRGNA